MSDSVGALFAKRKEKKQKVTVVNVEAVGDALQRRHQQKEQGTYQIEEDKRRGDKDEIGSKGASQEDEWIDTCEFDFEDGGFERLRVKDMSKNADEQKEEDVEDKHTVEVPTSGWGPASKKQQGDEEATQTVKEMAATLNPAPYRVRKLGSRNNMTSTLDFTNEEMFPTIGAAVEIEKHHKEEKKSTWVNRNDEPTAPASKAYVPPGRREGHQTTNRFDESASARETARKEVIEAVRKFSAAIPSTPTRKIVTEPERKIEATKATVEAVAANEGPKKPAYVPPHLRKAH